MPSRVFRNADGIFAVERDGVLFGPAKARRGTDIRVDDRVSEDWVALGDAEWTRSLDVPQFLSEVGGLRIERLRDGRAVVFSAPSSHTAVTVQRALVAHQPPKDERAIARDRLAAWKASGVAPGRAEVLDLLVLLEIR